MEWNISVTYNYIIELKDKKKYGLVLPPDQILLAPAENLDGLIGMVKVMADHARMVQIFVLSLLKPELPEEEIIPKLPKGTKITMEWTRYHNLAEINNWLFDIAFKYPQCKLIRLPRKSFEYRDIYGIKISHHKPNCSGIFIEANMHAREWITSATATWIINELITSKNILVKKIAENIDWYILPVLNPDGFVYTHEKDRMWRKTRKPYGNCFGTDPNRNFDFMWMLSGGSKNPCSANFAGPTPHSEPEILGLTEYISKLPPDKLKLYISLHAYGQLALSPWGHTNEEFPANYDDMLRVGAGFVNSVRKRYGTEYRYGASSVVLYNVSGSSKEWAYGVKKIPFTYTLELRDQGKYGFILPKDQIIPTAAETLDGIIGMIDAIPEKYKLSVTLY